MPLLTGGGPAFKREKQEEALNPNGTNGGSEQLVEAKWDTYKTLVR